MKRLKYIGIWVALVTVMPLRGFAQLEIIGEIVKEVIMAIDLKVQNAQTQTIVLQEAQKEAENLMEQTHLNDIIDWVQQQKDLYAEYYQELWQVKDALAAFERVSNMIGKEAQLIKDYQRMIGVISTDKHFSAAEINEIVTVYQSIFNQAAESVNDLSLVIYSLMTEMSDGDRLQLINTTGEQIDKNYGEFYRFTQENMLISAERAHDQADLDAVMSLYGIP